MDRRSAEFEQAQIRLRKKMGRPRTGKDFVERTLFQRDFAKGVGIPIILRIDEGSIHAVQPHGVGSIPGEFGVPEVGFRQGVILCLDGGDHGVPIGDVGSKGFQRLTPAFDVLIEGTGTHFAPLIRDASEAALVERLQAKKANGQKDHDRAEKKENPGPDV